MSSNVLYTYKRDGFAICMKSGLIIQLVCVDGSDFCIVQTCIDYETRHYSIRMNKGNIWWDISSPGA